MAQQANITVFDGASTPVSHTLIGEGVEKLADGSLVARWKESLIGVPDYAQMRITATKKKLPSGVFRVAFRAEVPVMESISGQNAAGYTAAPKVAYTDTAEQVGYYHERSTIAGRRLVRQIVTNLSNNVSTTVTPATAGFLPDLFDTLVQAT